MNTLPATVIERILEFICADARRAEDVGSFYSNYMVLALGLVSRSWLDPSRTVGWSQLRAEVEDPSTVIKLDRLAACGIASPRRLLHVRRLMIDAGSDAFIGDFAAGAAIASFLVVIGSSAIGLTLLDLDLPRNARWITATAIAAFGQRQLRELRLYNGAHGSQELAGASEDDRDVVLGKDKLLERIFAGPSQKTLFRLDLSLHSYSYVEPGPDWLLIGLRHLRIGSTIGQQFARRLHAPNCRSLRATPRSIDILAAARPGMGDTIRLLGIYEDQEPTNATFRPFPQLWRVEFRSPSISTEQLSDLVKKGIEEVAVSRTWFNCSALSSWLPIADIGRLGRVDMTPVPTSAAAPPSWLQDLDAICRRRGIEFVDWEGA